MPLAGQGRWIDLQLRPAPRLTWWGPAWALICGTIASGGWEPAGRDVLRIGLALFLVDPVLPALWGGLETLAGGAATSEAPFVHPLHLPWPARFLARLKRRLTDLGSPTGTSLLLLLLLTAALSAALGPAVWSLSLLAVLLAFVSLALAGSRSQIWAFVRALLEVAGAWVVGYVLFHPGDVTLPAWHMGDPVWPALFDGLRAHGLATLPALLFALAYFSVLQVSRGAQAAAGWGLFLLAQLGVGVILIGLHQPLFAAGILLLVAIQTLFRPWLRRSGGVWFLQQTQFYVMAIMLLTALGLRWVGRLPF